MGGAATGFAGAVPGCEVCSRIDPVLVWGVARLKESVSEVIMKTTAHQVCARKRNVAAPRGPNAVWLPAPPNAPARSAAFPLCSMITIIRTKHTMTCSVTSTAETRQPTQIRPTATSIDTAHFAHVGISAPTSRRGDFAPSAQLILHDGCQ